MYCSQSQGTTTSRCMTLWTHSSYVLKQSETQMYLEPIEGWDFKHSSQAQVNKSCARCAVLLTFLKTDIKAEKYPEKGKIWLMYVRACNIKISTVLILYYSEQSYTRHHLREPPLFTKQIHCTIHMSLQKLMSYYSALRTQPSIMHVWFIQWPVPFYFILFILQNSWFAIAASNQHFSFLHSIPCIRLGIHTVIPNGSEKYHF